MNNSKTNLSLSDSESAVEGKSLNQSKIRIFLVDDQKTILQILSDFLEFEPDLELIGSNQDSPTALQQIAKLHPDIAIIDMEMPGLDGLAVTQMIQQQFPATKILILSSLQFHYSNYHCRQLPLYPRAFHILHQPPNNPHCI